MKTLLAIVTATVMGLALIAPVDAAHRGDGNGPQGDDKGNPPAGRPRGAGHTGESSPPSWANND